MESHTQKESSRNPRNKKSLISTKKYSWKPVQQTGTSGRQNLGIKDKTDSKEKTWRILRQKTQELWKEYARTPQLHEKTKPVNHGNQRKRRSASQMYT
jgi:lantibiotic modifying enzyme